MTIPKEKVITKIILEKLAVDVSWVILNQPGIQKNILFKIKLSIDEKAKKMPTATAIITGTNTKYCHVGIFCLYFMIPLREKVLLYFFPIKKRYPKSTGMIPIDIAIYMLKS